MYQILEAKELTTNIYLMVVEAPRVARACEPGEFVIVKMGEEGERIPLTICDFDRQAGTITIVFQTVGASTEKMSTLKAGDAFHDFVGPLGNPSEFIHEDVEELKKKKYLFVAGGVGAAPVYPHALRDAGIGGRVVVRGVVGINGRVESAEVVRSSGNSTLDNNALSAFYKWRFSPAKNDAGQKVRCYFVQGFPFVIEYK